MLRYYRSGAHRTADPLYGAPRGNRVMKSKRTTGASAQRILITHVTLEKCHVPGCTNPVCVTRNPDGVNKLRQCIEHVSTTKQKRRGYKPSDLLKFPWQ